MSGSGSGSGSGIRIDQSIATGTFSLDGQTFDVDNNLWTLGDDDECIVIDAPHNVEAIRSVIAGRRVLAIVCTHAHDDHVRVAPELAQLVDAPILLNEADLPVWQLTHPDLSPDGDLPDGKRLVVAGTSLEVLHTPGHSPGAVCLFARDLGVVFTGDTLFKGGPGATGRSFSDHDMLVRSIRARLFTLPAETAVHTGHGDSTTIGAELADLGR